MADHALSQPYQPNPLLSYLYQRFFEHITVDETWIAAVRKAAARGPVLYVLRNLSFLDFLALDHLTKRHGLPQIRFANDLGLWILEPMGKGWLKAVLPTDGPSPAAQLADALATGSAALFLKRPPTMLERSLGRDGPRQSMSEGDDLIRALLDLQRKSPRPIQLVPQVFVWTKRPDTRGANIVDAMLGPREWPGKLRTTVQFLANYRNVVLRAGDPVDLAELLASSQGDPDETIVRRLTYAMLRKLERERRAILGPVHKPNDRIRDEVIRSPRLQQTIKDLAGEGERERLVITARAYGMLRKLEAQPELDVVKGFDVVLNQVVNRVYDGMEVDEAGLERVREALRRGTVIVLPSHKSHVDYLMLSWVFFNANMPTPVIAAGDNLSFFPLGPILRRGGGFFIRRSFKGDRLYAAVVDAYIRRLIRDGYLIEFFLEGGRSRTGKLLPPKVGLLNMVVEAALTVPNREVYFVPVSIGYERLMEGGSYVRELSGGEKKQEDARGLLRTTRLLQGRYGRLNIQFGDIITMTEAKKLAGIAADDQSPPPARRRGMVQRLGHAVMGEINRVTAATPGSVVALALLTGPGRGTSHGDLVAACERYTRVLQGLGVRISRTLVDEAGRVREGGLRDAAQLFADADTIEIKVPGDAGDGADRGFRKRARIYTGADVMYLVPDEKRLGLDLSKNIIVHFFVPRALVATALLVPGGRRADDEPRGPLSREVVADRVRKLSRLFKFEFQFRADQSFDDNLGETLVGMASTGEIVLGEGGAVSFGAGHDGLDGRAWVRSYASMIRNFLESYRIAARALTLLVKGPMPAKELAKKALGVGERMFVAGDVQRREAINRPVIENAISAFVDQGYLVSGDGKLSLAPSFATAEAVSAVEGRIVGYWSADGEAP